MQLTCTPFGIAIFLLCAYKLRAGHGQGRVTRNELGEPEKSEHESKIILLAGPGRFKLELFFSLLVKARSETWGI